jgi:hypothetical protein
MPMPMPRIGPFEINLNTLVIVGGFLAGIATWGATWERISSGQQRADLGIERLERRMVALETNMRTLDNHELRISAVERAAAEAAVNSREMNVTVNGVVTDIKVIREIVQRIEASSQNPRRSP